MKRRRLVGASPLLALETTQPSWAQTVGAARRVAFIFNENNPSYETYGVAAQQTCAARGLTAILVTASNLAPLPAAIDRIVAQRAQGLVLMADPFYASLAETPQQLLPPTQLPTLFGLPDHVKLGGLLCVDEQGFSLHAGALRRRRAQAPRTVVPLLHPPGATPSTTSRCRQCLSLHAAVRCHADKRQRLE